MNVNLFGADEGRAETANIFGRSGVRENTEGSRAKGQY